jgi:hypothetical protein
VQNKNVKIITIHNMHNLSLIFLFLLLSGCNSQNKNIRAKLPIKEYDESIARISAIPDTPFFACIESFSEDPTSMYNIIVQYRFAENLETKVIIDFYLQEMERSGWKKIVMIDAHDQIMIFEKPYLLSVIEIRPKEKRYSLVLGRKLID